MCATIFTFFVLVTSQYGQDDSDIEKSFDLPQGFELLMREYYSEENCKQLVEKVVNYLQHFRLDYDPKENRWECKIDPYGHEVCSNYKNVKASRKIKRTQSPYNNKFGQEKKKKNTDENTDENTALAAHHIIPHNILIEFFENVLWLDQNIPEGQKFFFIINLYNLSEKMREFVNNEAIYFNMKGVARSRDPEFNYNFNLRVYEWFPGNIVMGMSFIFTFAYIHK